MPLLDSVRGDFADRNVLLHLLLGLISVSKRIDGILSPVAVSGVASPVAADGVVSPVATDAVASPVAAKDEPAAEAGPAGSSPRAPAEDRLLYATLGVLSIRRTLMAEMESVRTARDGEIGTPAPPTPSAPELRLRDLLR